MEDPVFFDVSDENASLETSQEFPWPLNLHSSRNPPSPPKLTSTVSLSTPTAFNGLYPDNESFNSFYHQTDNFPNQASSSVYNLPLLEQGAGNKADNNLKRRHEDEDSSTESDDQSVRHRRLSSEPPPRKTRSCDTRRRISEEEWNGHRPTIESLLIQQNKKLKDAIVIMETKHHFKASRSAYKTHLRIWGVKKNLSHNLKVLMWKKMSLRKEKEGKNTQFRYQNAIVPEHKIRRVSSACNNTISVISTPSSLSMFTPNEGSRAHSAMSIRIRDQSRSNVPMEVSPSLHSESQQVRSHTPVVIHQRIESQSAPESVVSPTSIQERLDEHSWNHQYVFEELRAIQTIGPLVDLLRKSISQRTNELLLEIILTKTEEMSDTQNTTYPETQERAISLAKSLVFQHKYWQASLILKGMCTGPDLLNLRSDHKIKLLKLRLLVDVGEDFEEPRLLANIEGRCKVLLTIETCEEERSSLRCKCPGNLILAYLFRLYGIKCHDLDPSAVSTMAATLKQQLSLEKPPLSAIWAAQQYIRTCLRNGYTVAAERVLDSVRRALLAIGRKDGPEADLNTHLTEVLQSLCRNNQEGPAAPEIVDVYYKYPVDSTWLEALKIYIEDEPHSCPDEIRRTRDMDTEYWQ